MYYNVGSPKYMSPEAYYECEYSQKSDIWALGMTLLEMLTGSTLDKGLEIDEYFALLRKFGLKNFLTKLYDAK